MKTADDKHTAETLRVCFAEIERVTAFTKKNTKEDLWQIHAMDYL